MSLEPAPVALHPRVDARRGSVVLVALIAMVAMSLGAVALMRSVDATSAIAGNIAFRQSTQAMSFAALERALFDLLSPGGLIDPRTTDIGRNYYPVWQDSDDAFGVPAALRGDIAGYPATFRVLKDGSGNAARYVIERMCLPPWRAFGGFDMDGQPPQARHCETIPPLSSGVVTESSIEVRPYYRVTIRVDGPANATSYAQAMIAPGRNRLSWRFLGQ